MKIIDWLGDLKGYSRCDSCNHTFWRHDVGSFMRFNDNVSTCFCNRCGLPLGRGRLYKVREDGTLKAANKEAYAFEKGIKGDANLEQTKSTERAS